MKTERIAALEKETAIRGKKRVESHFREDYHSSALTKFADCELWEKTARAMAYAIENQDVYAYPEDTIGGRVYHTNEKRVTKVDPDLDCDTEAYKAFRAECPEAPDLE